MQPVAAAADVRQDERHGGMPHRERAELDRVGRFLTLILAPAVLPDVVQDGKTVRRGAVAHRIEERVIGAPARRQLEADHPLRGSPYNLGERVRCIVRVDGDVPADPPGMLALERALDRVGVLTSLGEGK